MKSGLIAAIAASLAVLTATMLRLPTEPLPLPPVSRMRSIKNSDLSDSGRGTVVGWLAFCRCSASRWSEIPKPARAEALALVKARLETTNECRAIEFSLPVRE